MSKQHAGAAARREKVSRRQAEEAREQLSAGGLSHQERRKLRSVATARESAARQRRGHIRHLLMVAAGTVAAMAVVAAATGLISAIEASSGQGRAGTFIVGSQPCLNPRVGCLPPGSFRLSDGVMVQHVQYDGALPSLAAPGTSVPAILPAGSTNTAYPPHGSRTWIHDVLLMVLVGAVVAALLWLFPIGLGRRETGDAVI